MGKHALGCIFIYGWDDVGMFVHLSISLCLQSVKSALQGWCRSRSLLLDVVCIQTQTQSSLGSLSAHCQIPVSTPCPLTWSPVFLYFSSASPAYLHFLFSPQHAALLFSFNCSPPFPLFSPLVHPHLLCSHTDLSFTSTLMHIWVISFISGNLSVEYVTLAQQLYIFAEPQRPSGDTGIETCCGVCMLLLTRGREFLSVQEFF